MGEAKRRKELGIPRGFKHNPNFVPDATYIPEEAPQEDWEIPQSWLGRVVAVILRTNTVPPVGFVGKIQSVDGPEFRIHQDGRCKVFASAGVASLRKNMVHSITLLGGNHAKPQSSGTSRVA